MIKREKICISTFTSPEKKFSSSPLLLPLLLSLFLLQLLLKSESSLVLYAFQISTSNYHFIMATPSVPRYMQSEVMRYSIDLVVPGALLDPINQFWLNMLLLYFLWPDFYHERKSITNFRQGALQTCLVIETRRFPRSAPQGWEGTYNWLEGKNQLQERMDTIRATSGNVQTIYAILAVGDKVRIYEMGMQNDLRNDLTPRIAGDPILDINTDGQLIETQLMGMAALAR